MRSLTLLEIMQCLNTLLSHSHGNKSTKNRKVESSISSLATSLKEIQPSILCESPLYFNTYQCKSDQGFSSALLHGTDFHLKHGFLLLSPFWWVQTFPRIVIKKLWLQLDYIFHQNQTNKNKNKQQKKGMQDLSNNFLPTGDTFYTFFWSHFNNLYQCCFLADFNVNQGLMCIN